MDKNLIIKMKILRKEIQKLKKENELLNYKVYTDLKFHCKNRNWFEDFKKSYYEKKTLVIMLDLNGLKALNDNIGHNAGDGLIQDVLDKIKFNRELTFLKYEVARLGGDEFVILIDIEKNDVDRIVESLAKDLGNSACLGSVLKNNNSHLYSALKRADALVNIAKDEYYKKNGLNRRQTAGVPAEFMIHSAKLSWSIKI